MEHLMRLLVTEPEQLCRDILDRSAIGDGVRLVCRAHDEKGKPDFVPPDVEATHHDRVVREAADRPACADGPLLCPDVLVVLFGVRRNVLQHLEQERYVHFSSVASSCVMASRFPMSVSTSAAVSVV